MTDKIKAYIQKHHMIAEGDTVIAGVSGGADSVCLLLLLLKMQRDMKFEVRVVHVEHGVRGAAGREDALFVERLCADRGVSFVRFDYDVPKIAAQKGISVEEAGRQLRYRAFETEALKYESPKIAVAHNKNDSAETMLYNLARGSEAAGIAGIAPVRGKVIRPLLCVERAEIEAWLKERRQDFRTDATNFETIYTRNIIRHQVMPVLRQLNPAAVKHMAKTANAVREMQEYMAFEERRIEKRAVVYGRDSVRIIKEQIADQPMVMKRLLCYETLAAFAGSKKDISSVHVEALCGLLDLQVGKIVVLPYGLYAKRNYDGILIQRKNREETNSDVKETAEEIWLTECADFTCRVFDVPKIWKDFPKKKYTKWLDYDKIKDKLCVRGRRPGDFFYLKEDGSCKKLKQYFIDEKIPQEQRDKIILVADASHIVWIVGYRISAGYKITENTRRVLSVEYNGGKEDE